mmetsp:Transcript_8244/g.21249  ORF Transcript_8244/g.21249 Transcript_8244/m.21249 type:complete len:362 (+) Transcript_8244:176-1261(+)
MDHFGLGSEVSIGFVSSSFALGRFCTTSLWPIASDYVGRRRILCIALLGGALGATLQGATLMFHWPFLAFLVARGLAGMFSGIVPVIKAYIFDAFDSETVPRVLAQREAAGTMAFVIGPAIGGVLASFCFASPFFFSAGAGGVAALLAIRCLTEPGSQRAERPKGSSQRAATPRSGDRVQVGFAKLLLLSFIWACTRTCFHTYYPLLIKERFALSVAGMGAVLTSVSLLVACIQAVGFEPCRKRLGLRGVLLLGGLLVGVGLAGLGAAPKGLALMWIFLAFSAAYGAGVALLSPVLPALLLLSAPPDRRGTLLGIESAVVNFGRIVAPPLFGAFYSRGAVPAAAAATALATTMVWWASRSQ